MTLLELLVKELPKKGGWPEGVAVLVQEDNGDVHGCNEVDVFRDGSYWDSWDGDWILTGDARIFISEVASDFNKSFVTFQQYEAALGKKESEYWRERILNEDLPVILEVEWNGEGIPPAGTVCEYNFYDRSGDNWEKVTILYSGSRYVIVDWDGEECDVRRDASLFRQSKIDTSRNEAISAILKHDPTMTTCMASNTYDAIAAGIIPGLKVEKTDE